MTNYTYDRELRKLHRRLRWTAKAVGSLGGFWSESGGRPDDILYSKEVREGSARAAVDAYRSVFRRYIDLSVERGMTKDEENDDEQ